MKTKNNIHFFRIDDINIVSIYPETDITNNVIETAYEIRIHGSSIAQKEHTEDNYKISNDDYFTENDKWYVKGQLNVLSVNDDFQFKIQGIVSKYSHRINAKIREQLEVNKFLDILSLRNEIESIMK